MKNKHLNYIFYITLSVCSLFSASLIQAADVSASNGSTTKPQASTSNITLDVYKNESCDCCGKWVDHIKVSGFKTTVHVAKDMNDIKNKHGISPQYQSCHTAISKEGYIFEGHIPAKVITQFLAHPSKDALGLAVPGMPVGSPGMEMGDKFMPYDVLLLKKDGTSEVYARISTIDQAKQ